MKNVINDIKQKLSSVYPPEEIESFIRIILHHIWHIQPYELWSGKDTQILPKERELVEEIVLGLLNHEPIQYLLGETEFYGLPFVVNKHVLIPRPETEELVEWILEDVKKTNMPETFHILDIGTGSGCIAVSLAKHLPKATVYGMDVSVDALHIANQNANLNQVQVTWILQDILMNEDLSTLPLFDVIVSNPPYITPSEQQAMEQNVLDYEPHLALFVPEDQPLLFYNRIAEVGKRLLKNNGSIYFEINSSFGKDVSNLLQQHEYHGVRLKQDISGNDRMVKANLTLKV